LRFRVTEIGTLRFGSAVYRCSGMQSSNQASDGEFQLCRRSLWTSNPTRGRGHIKDRITIPYCSLKRPKEPSVTRDALARAQGFVCHNHVSILWARVSHPEGQERLHSRGKYRAHASIAFPHRQNALEGWPVFADHSLQGVKGKGAGRGNVVLPPGAEPVCDARYFGEPRGSPK
jgi:hypothetical protein